jgi:hypothetical protein
LKVLKDQKLGKEEKKFDFSLLEGEDLKDWKLTEELKTQWANKFGKELQK